MISPSLDITWSLAEAEAAHAGFSEIGLAHFWVGVCKGVLVSVFDLMRAGIHTDPFKDTLIPPSITKAQASAVYASEADLLNVALFGQTAKQWRDANPDAKGNLRDHAPLEQLVVLTNLESLNSGLIRQGLPQSERLTSLNDIAITQMRTLLSASGAMRLK